MTFTVGVILFAVAIGFSIALHEFGHLLTAKAFGMKATQYFIGFGPRLWSFKRGETEYGLKAIPAGGYVKIVGMTHLEELPETDEPRAFWRYAAWKRCIVMSAGSVTHFLLALLVLYGAAVATGLPTTKALVGEVTPCVVAKGAPDGSVRDCQSGDPVGPAQTAGLKPKDQVVAIDGKKIDTYNDLLTTVRARPGQTVPVEYIRDGKHHTASLSIATTERKPFGSEKPDPATGLVKVGAIGVAGSATESFTPTSAVGGTFSFTGTVITGTFSAIADFPQKIPKLIDSLSGQQRDPDTPVSVVGASRVGGQALEAGSWLIFALLFASFNIFVGIFNMFPLLPLDGGHVAILLFERFRAGLARMFGRPEPGRVDLNKLMPITALVIVLFGGLSLLTILADVFNPIDNPFR